MKADQNSEKKQIFLPGKLCAIFFKGEIKMCWSPAYNNTSILYFSRCSDGALLY